MRLLVEGAKAAAEPAVMARMAVVNFMVLVVVVVVVSVVLVRFVKRIRFDSGTKDLRHVRVSQSRVRG